MLVAGAVAVLGASGGALAYFKPWRREQLTPPPKPVPLAFSEEQQATAAKYSLPVERTDDFGISFVLIPPGQAWVGTVPEEIERIIEGEPDTAYHPFIRAEVRRVIEIPHPVYLARTELTIGQMKAIVGPRRRFISEVEAGRQKGYAFRNGRWAVESGRSWQDAGPEFPMTDDHPAINLTWFDATNLTRMLNLPKGGPRYFLPDEDFWEYACVAGVPQHAPGGEVVPIEDVSVFDVPRPLPVRSRLPNHWGLFDMLGNLLEWCLFAPRGVKADNSTLAPLRGGKFNDKAYRIRPAARVWEPKTSPLGGLRLAMIAVSTPAGRDRVFGKEPPTNEK